LLDGLRRADGVAVQGLAASSDAVDPRPAMAIIAEARGAVPEGGLSGPAMTRMIEAGAALREAGVSLAENADDPAYFATVAVPGAAFGGGSDGAVAPTHRAAARPGRGPKR